MPRIVFIAVSTVFILGGSLVRLPGLADPILTFHPTRQYRSAIIARACYYDDRPDVPPEVRRVARANRAMQPAGEPPLLEWVSCAAWRAAGRESLAVPRTLSAAVWVLGAVPLALTLRRAVSAGAALVGMAIYLFAPYGIIASRAFQPDPLMTSCCLCAIWLLVRNHECASGRALAAASIAVAVTLVVKPMSLFLVVPAAFGLAVARSGVAGAASDRRLIAQLTLGLLPATILYGYSTIFGTLARDQWQMRFVPSLLVTRFFWAGWARQIARVFGPPLLVTGVAGAVLGRQLWMRAMLAGLWLGYAAFAVGFTYHMPTHDYYHLPFLPIAALGAAVVVDRLLARAASWNAQLPRESIAVVMAGLVAVSGSLSVWPRLTTESARQLDDYDQIGELCGHDARVLFLDHEYGYPLMYHSGISGDAWPSSDDLAAEALGGEKPVSAAERFTRDFEGYDPHYFVATDLSSLDAQPDLQALLQERTTLVASTPTYRIYRFKGWQAS
jgi:dolichyl-phosphate-mannose-protein mannosyltransferase